jgi:glycosyl transferase, family 25
MTPLYTILISLKRSEARRKHAIESLAANPLLQWEVLEGVDGLQLQHTPPEYREGKVCRLLGFPLTPSEIGCFLSHRLAWIRCVEKDCDALILEDDFAFRPHFEQAISTLYTQYPNWDIARLQGLAATPDSPLALGSDYQIVSNNKDPLGATAYIIKPSAAKKLIAYSSEIFEPLDHFLEHQKIHKLKIVAYKPYPIEVTGMVSTMHDRFDRAPIKGIRKKLRSLHRAIDRLLNSKPWFPK